MNEDQISRNEKLKSAISEINAIMDKHDIGGAIFLHTPGDSQYLIKVDTSYSVLKIDQKGKAQLSLKGIIGDQVKMKKIAHTKNMLELAKQSALHVYNFSDQILKQINYHFKKIGN